jgi:acyl-coenzyme A thioesterase PaaI-like protein
MAQFPDVHSFAEGSASQPGLPIADGSDLRAETLKPRPVSVDDLVKTAFLNRPDLHVGTEGEFAGWRTWTRDNFESHNGPFWHRIDDHGRMQCAFRVEKKHLNGAGNVHGGCFMAFADYCLFATASPILEGPGVTMTFACEFLDAAREGELIEGRAEIIRAGGSMIFLRGLLTSGEGPVFAFSGTIKRVKRRPPAAASSDAR